MLKVTAEAREELHGMLMQATAARSESPAMDSDSAIGFRLVTGTTPDGEEPQLGLTLDAPREGDEIVEHDGRSVLILDPLTSVLLQELTLDVFEDDDGSRLGLRR